MPTDHEARQQIVQITAELFSLGHLTASGGNVSARADEDGTFWITPSRLFKGDLREEDLVRVRADGSVIEGRRPPSIEVGMHARAYEARPGMTGAVHTHSPVATAFGIANQSFPPINTDAVLLADTPLVPWRMPGSPELADAVHEALGKSRGCILQNHGLMTVGATLRDASKRAMLLEETAKIVLYTKQFGGSVSLIPPEGIARLASLSDFV